VAQKYIEAFASWPTSPNQKVLIVPMEATAVLGSLAGIGEIAKATLAVGDSSGGAPRTVPPQPTQADRSRRLHHARPIRRQPEQAVS